MASKKISRKDISKMSFREFMRVSREPYVRLGRYLKPYRGRFGLGILFGALFGVANGGLIVLIRQIVPLIFPDGRSYQLKIPVVDAHPYAAHRSRECDALAGDPHLREHPAADGGARVFSPI